MPFLGYIDARDPEPDHGAERPAWEPDWNVWRWVAAAVVLAFAASSADGAAAVLLTVACFMVACRAATAALPYGKGLSDHRQ